MRFNYADTPLYYVKSKIQVEQDPAGNDFQLKIPIYPTKDIHHDYISLLTDGTLILRRGYPSDGASGPIRNTTQNMRSAAVHDALYEFMRWNLLNRVEWRDACDDVFRDICRADGVGKWRVTKQIWKQRTRGYKFALKKWGRAATLAKNRRITYRAPKK